MSAFKQQVVKVKYIATDEFKVPVGINLNDKTQVKNYYVQGNELFIILKDKEKELVIQSTYNMPDNFDWQPENDITVVEENHIVVSNKKPEPEMTEEEYLANHSIAKEFEKRYAERIDGIDVDCAYLEISFDNAEMNDIVSAEKAIVLRQTTDCYCYCDSVGFLPKPKITTIPVPYEGRPITKRDCCEAIVKSNWKCCNHCFLEYFDKGNTDDERIMYLGS
jgi:hypothetical protein